MAEPEAPGSSQAPGMTEALRQSMDRDYAGADPYYRGRRDALRELAESGGLPSAQLGLEILYLLPDDFVKGYQEIFHAAMQGGRGEAISGRGGGIEKSGGAKGIVLGSEVGAQASGTGKRWRSRTSEGVGSEKALDVKQSVDTELRLIMDQAQRALRSKADKGKLPAQCRGSLEGRNGVMKKCRRFLRPGWNYCPSCGTGKD